MTKDFGIQILSDHEISITVVRDELGVITSGLNLGNTLYQNEYLILESHKGEFKEIPDLGVGLDDLVNDEDIEDWKRTIREEFKKDGLKVSKLNIGIASMEIIATY